MKKFLLALLLLIPTQVSAQSLFADTAVDMNVVDANGTTLTAPILTSGTQGVTPCTWSLSIAPPITGMTVESSSLDRPASYVLRNNGTTFTPSATHRRIKFDHSVASRTVLCTFVAGRVKKVSLGQYITFGPHDVGGAGTLFDYIVISSALGHTSTLQLNNGNGAAGSGYAINIETDESGTTHSSYSTITPFTTYWVTFVADYSIGGTNATTVSLYDITTKILVASITANLNVADDTVQFIRWGNNEIGTDGVLASYFEDIIIDSTKGAFPLGPTGLTYFWTAKSGAGGGAGASTFCAVTIPNVSIGDVINLGGKWEGGAGGTITGTESGTGATLSLLNPPGDLTNSVTGDPHSALVQLLSTTTSGSITYTFNIGASRTFRDCVGVAATRPTGTVAQVLTGVTGSSSGSSTSAVSSNTNPATGGIGNWICSFYGEFGSAVNNERIKTFRPDIYQVASAGNSAMFCGGSSSTDNFVQGATIATLITSNSWNIIASAVFAGLPSGSPSQFMMTGVTK